MSAPRVVADLPDPPEVVWGRVTRSFGTGEPRIGDRLALPGPGAPLPCRVLDAEPGKRVVLAWADPESTVEITLTALAVGSRVTVVHHGAPPTRAPGLTLRWRRWADEELGPRDARWVVGLVSVGVIGVAAILAAMVWRGPPGPSTPAPSPAPVTAAPARPAPARLAPEPATGVAPSGPEARPEWAVGGDYLSWEAGGGLWIARLDRDGRLGPAQPVALPGGGAALPQLESTAGGGSWMREGYVLFVGSVARGDPRVYYRAASGGRASELLPRSALPGALTGVAMSPDGHTTIVEATVGLVARDTDTAKVRQLTEPGARWPAVSHDDATVAFVRDGHLYTVALAGGEELHHADQVAPGSGPAWTADGSLWWRRADGAAMRGRGSAAEVWLARTLPDDRPATTADGAFVAVARADGVHVLRVADGVTTIVDERLADPALVVRYGRVWLAGVDPEGHVRLSPTDATRQGGP
jgi:hypothetical protein